ncbi:hypothetical protein VOLCADRAFT_96159 [Volvox carteri f. nagariensis]|uniref:Uncharacterized protein n=1 Tax=Volvox carteri f. nagariensis TaxID=3068 RepID=D8U9D1_VOLCA|nr:uncharacterized protein VOLCADRAFT_96159 [Volvox carteri f. nagariensis]EFJ43618.1 hypothetical protein VOLCADRAFT_96159 [Volvox carteri f. nagariensis]|eukprot:XP_002955318.1 hypothetical protein VOLCADRAFT_96159 [Volvox carteri f. nagariensis]
MSTDLLDEPITRKESLVPNITEEDLDDVIPSSYTTTQTVRKAQQRKAAVSAGPPVNDLQYLTAQLFVLLVNHVMRRLGDTAATADYFGAETPGGEAAAAAAIGPAAAEEVEAEWDAIGEADRRDFTDAVRPVVQALASHQSRLGRSLTGGEILRVLQDIKVDPQAAERGAAVAAVAWTKAEVEAGPWAGMGEDEPKPDACKTGTLNGSVGKGGPGSKKKKGNKEERRLHLQGGPRDEGMAGEGTEAAGDGSQRCELISLLDLLTRAPHEGRAGAPASPLDPSKGGALMLHF